MKKTLDLVPLLLVRQHEQILLPKPNMPLEMHDQILFCGTSQAKFALPLSLNNIKTMTYVVDGIEFPESVVWRYFKSKFAKKTA